MLLVAEIKHLNALMDNKPLVTLRQSNNYANNQPEKKKNPEIRSNSQQIALYCLGLHTDKSVLNEVDLEPRTKKGSDRINMLKQEKNTKKSKSSRTDLTHILISGLRGDLEPSTKRETNRTRALVILYWLSQSWHLKQSSKPST